MTGVPTLDWIIQAGPMGIMLVGFALVLRGDLVPRRYYDEAREELQGYRANAAEALVLSQRLARILEDQETKLRQREAE